METGNWESKPLGYTTVEMLLDDVSKQMASSNLSRGSNGQKAGGSIRVMKPNSTNNSPRGSAGLGRRRTVMSDGAQRRRIAMLEQHTAMSAGGFVSNDGLQAPSRAPRPVSWHPTSRFVPQQQYQPAVYQFSNHGAHNQYQMYDAPSNQAVYSGQVSPDSSFSPVSMPFTGYETQYQYQNPSPPFPSNHNYHVASQPQYQQQHLQQQPQDFAYIPQSSSNEDPSMYSHFVWNPIQTTRFENTSTAPPTPENFLPIQHPEPTLTAEDSIPYHPLCEPDSDGEELIGMGLYDTPEVAKTPSSNPQLEQYQALMMTQYLGAGHRTVEATGKGLKLEETWQPPASDDGESDDDEQDGEAEDDDESNGHVQPSAVGLIHGSSQPIELGNYPVAQTQMSFTSHGYGGPGWL